MARFELLAPHILVLGGVSRQVDAGTIVDSAEVSNFSATPLMRALDQIAYEEIRRVCDQIRAVQHWAGRRPDPNVPGFGHAATWAGGELAPPFMPPDAPLAWIPEDRKWS
jgi:hypothetical protein